MPVSATTLIDSLHNDANITAFAQLQSQRDGTMEFDHPFCKEVLESFHEGVYFVDPDRVITFWNKGAEAIAGYTASDIVGK